MNKPISDLINYAHDGVKFYKAVMARLAPLSHSLNALCDDSGVDFSTTHRWKKKGSKPDIVTIMKLEATFKKWEKQHDSQLLQRQHTEGALIG